MFPAGFNSSAFVKGRLQAALYSMRKKNRARRQVVEEIIPPPDPVMEMVFSPASFASDSRFWRQSTGVITYGDLISLDPAEITPGLEVYIQSANYDGGSTFIQVKNTNPTSVAALGSPPWEARLYEGGDLIGSTPVNALHVGGGASVVNDLLITSAQDITLRLVEMT